MADEGDSSAPSYSTPLSRPVLQQRPSRWRLSGCIFPGQQSELREQCHEETHSPFGL